MENRLDQHIRFWAVLGPFLMLMTLFVMVIRSTPEDLYIALSILIGLPICWKWKHTGLALAFAFLGSGLVLSVIYGPLEDRFWYFGISLATAMAFVVTSLSLEEVAALIGNLQFESKSRKDHLWSLDERYQSSKDSWEREKGILSKEIAQKENEVLRLKELLVKEKERENVEELEKIEQFRKNQSRLEGELQHAKNRLLQQEIDASNHLKQLVYQYEAEVKEYKQNSYANEQLASQYRKETDELKQHAAHVLSQLQSQQDKLSLVKDGYEPLYKQLRQQFIEKNELLESTRRELFKSKEALLTLIRHHQEKLSEKEGEMIEQLESEYRTELSLLETSLEANQEEIQGLYSLITTLLKERS